MEAYKPSDFHDFLEVRKGRFVVWHEQIKLQLLPMAQRTIFFLIRDLQDICRN